MINAPSESKRSTPAAILLAVLLLTGTSQAASATDVRVSGFGTRKCSEWLDWKTARNGEARAMSIEWAQGFMAGHNVYARSGNGQANSVVADAKTLATLLDNYCQTNPDSRILSGVLEINQSLGGAKVTIVPKAPAVRDDSESAGRAQNKL